MGAIAVSILSWSDKVEHVLYGDRLVSVVLETCGQYFGKGLVAVRLDGFLLYLSRYLLSKPEPPLDVTLDLQVAYRPTPPF